MVIGFCQEKLEKSSHIKSAIGEGEAKIEGEIATEMIETKRLGFMGI